MSEIIALCLSSLSILVAIAALITSRQTQSKMLRIESRMLQIEQDREHDRQAEKQKANLMANITNEELRRSGTSRIYRKSYLVVENKGLCEARNIELVLDNKPAMEHPGISKTQREVKQVGPESSFQYELAVTGAPKVPSHAKITWEDDSGELGFYNTTLTS